MVDSTTQPNCEYYPALKQLFQTSENDADETSWIVTRRNTRTPSTSPMSCDSIESNFEIKKLTHLQTQRILANQKEASINIPQIIISHGRNSQTAKNDKGKQERSKNEYNNTVDYKRSTETVANWTIPPSTITHEKIKVPKYSQHNRGIKLKLIEVLCEFQVSWPLKIDTLTYKDVLMLLQEKEGFEKVELRALRSCVNRQLRNFTEKLGQLRMKPFAYILWNSSVKKKRVQTGEKRVAGVGTPWSDCQYKKLLDRCYLNIERSPGCEPTLGLDYYRDLGKKYADYIIKKFTRKKGKYALVGITSQPTVRDTVYKAGRTELTASVSVSVDDINVACFVEVFTAFELVKMLGVEYVLNDTHRLGQFSKARVEQGSVLPGFVYIRFKSI